MDMDPGDSSKRAYRESLLAVFSVHVSALLQARVSLKIDVVVASCRKQ